MTHHCGSSMFAGAAQVELCAPLAQLKQEHAPLRQKMDAIAAEIRMFGSEEDTAADWEANLKHLAELVRDFASELEPHSEREEGVLFPMMATYIGRETGPIAVMEYEHDRAKSNLKQFFVAAKTCLSADVVDSSTALAAASYAMEAYTILSDHFMKEENVLFPMAQQMLSAEEKEQLAKAIAAAV